jgi:tRNA(Ile)-lysidine synthase
MERALEVARESGLIVPGRSLLVMLSGGADSTCLLDVAVRLGAEVSALHVNYGLRPGADEDEAHCRELCARLGVDLAVERVSLPEGTNLQAAARDARYEIAERLATGDYAAGHTASDQAETVLYRLVTSPGRRALLGMEPRRRRLVRPLLEATAEETRVYCRERGLPWREDPSNEDPRFARSRIRHEALAALREVSPAAERSIVETSRLLRDEAEIVERAVDAELAELGPPPVELAALRARPPALARLVLRRLAEDAAEGAGPALSRGDGDAVLALDERGGTASLDVGGGVRAVVEYGRVYFSRAREGERPGGEPPEPATLPVPGSARFGAWTVVARPGAEAAPGDALLSADALGERLTVRSWRDGDRMRPAGLGGSKSLQDLFTDRKVPRDERRLVPVFEAEAGIAWVPGLAVDERFVARDDRTVVLSARRGER